MPGPSKHRLVALTPLIQKRIDALATGATARLKDLLEPDWQDVADKPGLDAIFARYVARGGRFSGLVPCADNLPGNRRYRRI
ncbi:MAG: hypothetical protein AAFV86_24385 [Pseudomonadota bacterium]